MPEPPQKKGHRTRIVRQGAGVDQANDGVKMAARFCGAPRRCLMILIETSPFCQKTTRCHARASPGVQETVHDTLYLNLNNSSPQSHANANLTVAYSN